jgi:tripartite ATP-independent transporter DctM subunit
MNSFTLIAIPLFIFMALILERTGLARSLYRMMHLWMGGLRGGLAIGTVAICTVCAAMVGISGAAVVAMGTVALPVMLEHGYDKKMALGAINAGGGLGILIPPSVVMIIYSLNTGVSVGSLFAAGILPGILLAVLVSLYIGVRCFLQPNMGPALAKNERATWSEKLTSVKAVILPVMIVVMVLGSILFGIATPTEAACIGVVGALISAAVYRTFSFKIIHQAAVQTLVISAMIMWIVIGAHAFTTAYNAMGAQQLIADLMQSLPGGGLSTLLVMLAIVFLMGMFLDPIGIMLITLPIFMPVVNQLGFDPIWFAILYIIMLEVGYMTPPFGFNLFYLKGVAPKEVTMGDIYYSVIPYVLVILLGMLIIGVIPSIVLYLPSILM